MYRKNRIKPYREGEYRPLPIMLDGKTALIIQTGDRANGKATAFA